ncbi:hypothetical protein OJAV_G00215870 [Oryzias javanicus]|uniref:Uncharacterized protein n=1 Tax=Oryzias javanicus TaxID=123683 RepID=A0A3S2NVD5_ORYJA|nr:hypothetical protein OJAV_G00215870 [Oryzias javanicus]
MPVETGLKEHSSNRGGSLQAVPLLLHPFSSREWTSARMTIKRHVKTKYHLSNRECNRQILPEAPESSQRFQNSSLHLSFHTEETSGRSAASR